MEEKWTQFAPWSLRYKGIIQPFVLQVCVCKHRLNKSGPNQDNSFLFDDLWFADTPPPMGGCMGGWVEGTKYWFLDKTNFVEWKNRFILVG